MKTRILFSVAVCATALLAFASCQKEENKGEALFTATIQNAATNGKTAISSTGQMTWSENDHIVIYGDGDDPMVGVDFVATRDEGNAKMATFSRNDNSDPVPQHTNYYYAKYPCDLTTAYNVVNLPETQSFNASRFDAPMYAKSSTRDLPFKNVCGVLQINLATNSAISTIVVSTPDNIITGNFTADYDATPVLTAPSTGGNTVTLNCGGSTATTYYIYLPPQSYTSMTITVTTTDGAVMTRTLSQTFEVAENTYYPINFTVGPQGAIHGLYSVSATKQVFFAQGNLKYTYTRIMEGTTWASYENATYPGTWSFMDNQWDLVENNGTVDMLTAESGTISLFCWGASGWSNNTTPVPNDGTRHYAAYHVDEPVSSGGTLGCLYGPRIYDESITDNPFHFKSAELTGDYAEADWSYNAITNGGNEAGLWRTLSKTEWEYVVNRDGKTKCGRGTVNGVQGFILLPDVFNDPKVNAGTSLSAPADHSFYPYGTRSRATVTDNIYSGESWTRMEAGGAVFLPAAGSRTSGRNSLQGTVSDRGSKVLYYTVTPDDYTQQNGWTSKAYRFSCQTNANNANDITYTAAERSSGHAVRSVRDYDGN